MTDLLHAHCSNVTTALAPDAVHAHLAALSGWALRDGAIEKRFEFANFHETIAFVNAVARISHAENHHPELVVSYSRCAVRYSTHSVHGISPNDFICATQVDALVAFLG